MEILWTFLRTAAAAPSIVLVYMWHLLTIFGLSFLSGFVPVFNVEIGLLSAAALAPGIPPLVLIGVATAGQMAASALLYWAGWGAVRLPLGRHRARVEAAAVRLQGPRGTSVVFTSALLGLPPFAVAAAAAGAVRLNALSFLGAGTAGRFLRFAAVAFLPHLLAAVFA